MRKMTIKLAALALGVALASGPVFAQQVSQTYPFGTLSPAFGPSMSNGTQPATRPPYARQLQNVYAYVPREQAARGVWQTYPFGSLSPAFGPNVQKVAS